MRFGPTPYADIREAPREELVTIRLAHAKVQRCAEGSGPAAHTRAAETLIDVESMTVSVKRCCDVRPVPAEVAKASAIEIVIPENIAHSVEPIQAQIICTTVKAVVAPADYPTMYRPKTVRQDPRLECERLSVKRQIGGSALRRVQTLEAAERAAHRIYGLRKGVEHF